MNNDQRAVLRYAHAAPTPEQIDRIKAFLSEKFDRNDIGLELIKDESVGGGFILSYANYEYDWSDQGRARQLRIDLNSIKTKKTDADTGSIIAMFKQKVEDFDLSVKRREIGHVSWVGDGIANIDGIEHAFFGEIIEFEDGTKGMVQDIRNDQIGCILFGDDSGIRQGSRAVRTFREAGVPVGDAFIGRIVDALGSPIDGLGDIKESDYKAVERPAPGIIDRQSVNEPLETGILSIDTMFPIGRGQRELIIGDRQTGKTSIAVDTILNQRGKDVICIYVAIGQKASSVAKIIQTLKKNRAMEYTIIVNSTASDPAPLQYIAPYSGTAIGEYFMKQGRDVLIVYDDLTKHAIAYRAISLLLERPPGREAYPGDVFYLHSRLLERASKLSSEMGGGSITALPIVETQDGDVSAYIPTNVISITDGQIFLESDLFFEGMRPAVNVGLSVSRVGSAAQTRAMKKASGSIRVDLAQYREMAVFTQFSSDLDETTRAQLNHGAIVMELLKQPLEHPLAMHDEVIILVGAGGKKMEHVPVNKVKEYKEQCLKFFNTEHSDICTDIEMSTELSDETKKKILDCYDEFNRRMRF